MITLTRDNIGLTLFVLCNQGVKQWQQWYLIEVWWGGLVFVFFVAMPAVDKAKYFSKFTAPPAAMAFQVHVSNSFNRYHMSPTLRAIERGGQEEKKKGVVEHSKVTQGLWLVFCQKSFV